MAVTGIFLVIFVLAHMIGNLQVFAGPDRLNHYAETLQNLGPVLWIMRIGLLAIFVTHLAAALNVNARNKAARPVPYASAKAQVTSYAARTMLMSGFVILAFLIYHILHFTLGVVQHDAFLIHDAQGRHDVYAMVVKGFQNPLIALSYIVAQVLLAMHISHGASSAFQTLGVTHPRFAFLKCGFGKLIGTLILLGNVAMPTAILLGFVKLPVGGH